MAYYTTNCQIGRIHVSVKLWSAVDEIPLNGGVAITSGRGGHEITCHCYCDTITDRV